MSRFSHLMLAGALVTTSALGQFDKYESKPRFGNDRAAAPGAANDSDANTEAFGQRTEETPIPEEMKSKYVQLNPETAFGPEIVESFDFPDADIMDVTRHMQKLTGLNLILDKEASGKKISISAPNPITVGDAWRAYLAALNMVNLTIVKTGAFYKIMNIRDIRYVPTKIYTGSYTPDTEQHVMKVISLKNIDANEVTRNFRPFMSRYGRIIDMKQTNAVILSDTGANIARLEKLIQFLDVPGFEESLQILPVANSSAQEIAKLISEILNDSGSSPGRTSRRSARSSSRVASPTGESTENISKIIAEPRTNSIIAMANAEGAKQLRALIKKLDVKSASTNSDKIHVHYLDFGNAEELSKTLSTLVSGSSSPVRGGGPGRRFIPAGDDGSTLFNGEVKVTADKNNNALVVTASATDWITLKSVIEKLDIPRDQVYIEGMIVETNINKKREFGTSYYSAYGDGNAERAGFNTSGGVADLISTGGTSLAGLFAGVGLGKAIEFTPPGATEAIKVSSVNALLKAVANSSNSNVLATPQILALDNTDAELEVGETVPTRQQTNAANGATTFTRQDQEAKLTLKFTPQINKQTQFVKLKINQTVNDFSSATDTTGLGLPTTTRSASTEVLIKNKDTIAMGGLLRDKEDSSLNKVPLLGDIPVLGWLFKSKTKSVTKTNILFFLTPTIIAAEDGSSKRNTLERIKAREKDIRESIAPELDLPYKDKVDAIETKLKAQLSTDTSSIPDYQQIAAEAQKGQI